MRLLRRLISFVHTVVRIGAALAVIVALVLVVPYLLVRYVGNPLPTAIPAWDEVVLSLQSRQLDDSLVVQALAVVVWVVWAQLLMSLIVEVRAAASGVKASAVRGLGATQWLARRLVAQFTLATTVFVQANVGLALPITPALADVVPAEVVIEESVGGSTPVGDPSPPSLMVQVQTSDTLWDLAQERLGDGARWTEIRDINVGRTMADGTVLDPNFVTISGNWSLLVPSDEGTQISPAAAGDTVIGAWRVEPGDHFWQMAETVLEEGWGRQATEIEIREYWLDIIAHNREHLISPGNDPNLIYADQSFEILLPPLPSDGLSADDGLATTMVRPLTGIAQFQPSGNAPPPTHRVTPDAESTDDLPADSTVETEVVDGPVVELTESDSTGAPVYPVQATGSEAEAVASGSGGLPVSGRSLQTLAVAGVGLTGVAAALILNSLRARRRYQASRRRPGSVPELPDQEHQQFEARVRSIADHEALRWLTATNKFLTHTLDGGESWHLPPIVAMRAGDHGLEVLLDEDSPAPRGFMDGNQPRSWILDPDIEVRQLESEASNRLPYAPLLLPVGSTGGGDLLLELAQFGVIGLDGPAEAIAGWLRALTVAVATSSWSENVEVVAIGVDPILDRMPHVEVPADPIDWARQEVERRLGEGPQPDSRYETRLRGQRVDETVVLVGPGHEGVAQHLVEVAELANSPFTLIAAAPVRGEGRIQFEGDRATLEPTGVTFWPSVMEAEAIAMTTTLLDQSADTGSVPVDVHYADEVPGVSVGDSPASRRPGDQPYGDSVSEVPEAINDERDVEWGPNPPAPPPKPEIPTTSVVAESAAASPSQSVLRHDEEDAADRVEVDREPLLFATVEDSSHVGVFEEDLDCDDHLAIDIADGDTAELVEFALPPEVEGLGESDRRSIQREVEAGEEQTAGADDPGVVDADYPGVTSEDAFAVGRLFEPEKSVDHGEEVAAPLGESERAGAEINDVVSRKPIEVVVLTPTPCVEGTLERLTPKNVSVLAYLAFHRSATSNAVREAFWPSSVNRSTSDNAISLIRRNVGRTDADVPRLNLASEGRFTVSDEIGCDWTRFQILVERAEVAKREHAVRDEMAILRAALELVDGPIASDVDVKNWPWLRDDLLVYSRVETAIVDAAHRLGYLGCEQGLPDLARWAADKGLAVVPEQEALYRIQMSAASLAGDGNTIASVFRQAQRSAQPHGDGVQPETELLYRRLVGLEQDDRAHQDGTG